MTQYKSERTGRPLTQKAAGDVLSRCHRVEELLKIELDAATAGSEDAMIALKREITKNGTNFGATARTPYAYCQYVHAVRMYARFLGARNKGGTERTLARWVR